MPPTSTLPAAPAATSRITEADCQTSLGQRLPNRLRRAVGMEGLSVGSVLLTGCDGGLGLGLLKGLLEQPSPPRYIFAACLDPQGKVRRAWRGGQEGVSSGMGAWGCHNPIWDWEVECQHPAR